MSERYSRLYSLPCNLYTEGSPVLISAGALLKDNQTGKILAQLKLRNISNKPIKSVKVKVNTYDTTKAILKGVEAFSYIDLSIAPNEEFGQSTPIHLPDETTRSFSVEILSVVYGDNEVFCPKGFGVVESAPKSVLEEIERVEKGIQEEKEANRIEQEQIKNKRKKQCQRILMWGLISAAFVFVSLLFDIYKTNYGTRFFLKTYALRYIIALLPPSICVITAFGAKRNPVILNLATVICSVLFVLQIVSMIIYYRLTVSNNLPLEQTLLIQEQFAQYVNGVEFGMLLQNFFDMIRWGSNAEAIKWVLTGMARRALAVIPNVLSATVLVIYGKKIK